MKYLIAVFHQSGPRNKWVYESACTTWRQAKALAEFWRKSRGGNYKLTKFIPVTVGEAGRDGENE